MKYFLAYLKKTASRNVIPGIKFPIAEARVGELYLIPVITKVCTKQILQKNRERKFYMYDKNKLIV